MEKNVKPRARELGLPMRGSTGPHNAITDVSGVTVGYETLSAQENPSLGDGQTFVQTGVTAILPRGVDTTPKPVFAGFHALNGNGEMTGTHWIRDGGYFVGPIMITNTHAVGAVHDAATAWIIDVYGREWRNNHLWAMPVVAETYDGVLNDINGQHVRREHALRALHSAKPGPVAEGNVGGGAGMICYEFKGGSGTSSRRIDIGEGTFTVGAFVQANHGLRPWLTICGVPVGRNMLDDRIPDMPVERGSIVCIIACDLPLLPAQLEKIARRATIGIGRGGTPGGNNSGDVFLAFSTANEMNLPQLSGPWRYHTALNDEYLDPVYEAAVDAIEESVINALLGARDVPTARPPGAICRAIDTERLMSFFVE